MTGIVGCAGLLPTVAAIKARKEICLANKETLIAGREAGGVVVQGAEGRRGAIRVAVPERWCQGGGARVAV